VVYSGSCFVGRNCSKWREFVVGNAEAGRRKEVRPSPIRLDAKHGFRHKEIFQDWVKRKGIFINEEENCWVI
jgi:hypothetical protein